jgi:hypothetical protein
MTPTFLLVQAAVRGNVARLAEVSSYNIEIDAA